MRRRTNIIYDCVDMSEARIMVAKTWTNKYWRIRDVDDGHGYDKFARWIIFLVRLGLI